MMTKITDKPDLRFAPSPGICCPKCKKTKATYEFALNRAAVSGRQSECRQCKAARREAAREKNRTNHKRPNKLECSGCGLTKNASDFHKNEATRRGVQTLCKACKRIYDKKRREAMKHRVEPIKPGAIVEVPVPERIGFFDRMVAFIFGGWLIR